ncbi:MAG: hypothetical protein B7Z78_10890 [Rhodospirillales bacterium 20-60-12]|nr:MAG: hypothetical protein B7Z78_10890 [Rhodospirillales bacterium 20-60-12]HQT66867.1 glycosyltransferase family 1 protein [Acetobacteraceae bacterium]
MTIWVDIEDLCLYFYESQRPTGIQRLSMELCQALWAAHGSTGAVKFCRHGPGASGLEEIDWPAFRGAIDRAIGRENEATAPLLTSNDSDGIRAQPPLKWKQRFARRLPGDVRAPLGVAVRHQMASLHAALDVLRALQHRFSAPFATNQSAAIGTEQATDPHAGKPGRFSGVPVEPAAGDIFLSPGATWQFPRYGNLVKSLRSDYGMKFAPLIYDIIPVLWPEWADRQVSSVFQTWLETMLPLADIVFTISESTADDVRRFAKRHGLPKVQPVAIPIGASFGEAVSDDYPRVHPRPYVLFVSTVEIRKNHALMFRLWRRLLNDFPAEQIPDLIFAGRVGWQTADLMTQAANSDYLSGKLRLIDAPSDRDLAALYRDCLFTVYPSFYEGWGLPVTESLCSGRTVVASNRASIPEAGGEFCVYFDPDDLNDAYRMVSEMIFKPGKVADLEARIRTRFQPPSWGDSAATVIATFTENALFNAQPDQVLPMQKASQAA